VAERESQSWIRGYCWGTTSIISTGPVGFPRGAPTIVWTGLIGHAFIDAYEVLGDKSYLEVAQSICEFIYHESATLIFKIARTSITTLGQHISFTIPT